MFFIVPTCNSIGPYADSDGNKKEKQSNLIKHFLCHEITQNIQYDIFGARHFVTPPCGKKERHHTIHFHFRHSRLVCGEEGTVSEGVGNNFYFILAFLFFFCSLKIFFSILNISATHIYAVAITASIK